MGQWEPSPPSTKELQTWEDGPNKAKNILLGQLSSKCSCHHHLCAILQYHKDISSNMSFVYDRLGHFGSAKKKLIVAAKGQGCL